MHRIIIIFVLTGLSNLCFSQSKNIEERIIGSWRFSRTNLGGTLEVEYKFNKDGTGVHTRNWDLPAPSLETCNIEGSMTWEIIPPDNLKMTYGKVGGRCPNDLFNLDNLVEEFSEKSDTVKIKVKKKKMFINKILYRRVVY